MLDFLLPLLNKFTFCILEVFDLIFPALSLFKLTLILFFLVETVLFFIPILVLDFLSMSFLTLFVSGFFNMLFFLVLLVLIFGFNDFLLVVVMTTDFLFLEGTDGGLFDLFVLLFMEVFNLLVDNRFFFAVLKLLIEVLNFLVGLI